MSPGRRFRAGPLIGLALVLGCSGGETGPEPGVLNLSLSSPNHDDGAVLFTISGGAVESIDGLGYALYSAEIDPNTTRVVIIGPLTSGTIARIRVPDARDASSYSASITQVAVQGTYLSRDPSSYHLVLAP